MKKLYWYLVCVALLLCMFHITTYAACDYSGGSIAGSLDGCLSWSDLVDAGWDMRVETGLKNQIISWTVALARFFWLLAVGAIVYGGLMMTISVGQDEKVKKWKDIVKWSLLGFLAIVLTWSIIRVIVELVFDIAW